MGMVRSTLYRRGDEARDAANRTDGKANIVPTDSDGKVFTRFEQLGAFTSSPR